LAPAVLRRGCSRPSADSRRRPTFAYPQSYPAPSPLPGGRLITTLGPLNADELAPSEASRSGVAQTGEWGLILPHEHVFVDLRTWDQAGYAEADPSGVVELMAPQIERARSAGVSAIVEASTVGVGRRADILRAVSEATEFPLLVPTGVYREPWIPDWIHAAAEEPLYEWMVRELEEEIEPSGVRAGWIKLSAGDDGLTATETKVLRAAARAAKATNAVTGSHTIRGSVVREQLDIFEDAGASADRFIWIHAQSEPEFALHLDMARRGAWVEYDAIGHDDLDDAYFIERIQRMLDAGLGERVLLSQDRGSYDPAQPGGGTPRPYTYLPEQFLPRLRSVGLGESTIVQLTRSNPFRAFAR
jgi:phosphotriesterase-related protein